MVAPADLEGVAMLSIALAALIAQADPHAPPTTSVVCKQNAPAAGEQLPSTISSMRLITAWLEVIQTSDDAAFIRFVQDRGPVLLGPPEQWPDLRNVLRGLAFCGVKSADADYVALWMFDPD